MPTVKPHRRPPLSKSLPCFLPSLIAVLIAIWIPHAYEGYALVLLLIGASLSMAAVCHAVGCGCGATFTRAVLRRGPAHLIALAIHTAIVFILVAWPLLVLSRAPSLVATLGLAAALAVAMALLWRLWPVFALVFAWDDAFPAGHRHSWITAALARSTSFASHLTRGRDLFATHFLPASVAQLAIAFCALALAGIGASLPDAIRSASLFLFAVVLLPVCSLIIANRTLRLALDDPREKHVPAPLSPAPTAMPQPPIGNAGDAQTLLEPVAEPPASSIPEGVNPALSQAALDEGLLVAAAAGDLAGAKQWLAQGANPAATPPPGARDQRSAPVRAAELPDPQLLRTLVAHGADVNQDHADLTPLVAATRGCRAGRPETVTTLIANGADAALADADGNTPLHHAALCQDPAIAALLIDAGAPLEARNHDQATPLAVAAGAANWPLLQLLVEHRADPAPALPAAAGIAEDDPEGVRTLLKHKAQVDAVDVLGRSALLHAARENHVQIVRALLGAHANPALADRYGATPLMEAARTGATDIVKLLAAKHPDPSAVDRRGRTALLLACQSPRTTVDCVRTLLALGADPSREDGDGRNAIDHAGGAGRQDLVALLDPEAPLPASRVQESEPEPDTQTPPQLLDALRSGHWNMAQQFSECARRWPQRELATLYLDLAAHPCATARSWLLDHGLAAEARLDDGSRLFDALLDRLPESADAVEQLLRAGATPAGAGRFARALARLGEAPKDTELALSMLQSGADAFGADPHDRVPLHHACRPALLPVFQALLARGADPNVRDRAGATPLHVALDADPDAALPLVKALIAHGADPERPAAGGETPLGLALARGAQQLEYWLRWNDWNLPGRPLRPEDLPAAAADPDAIARLLELGLPIDARDERGATTLVRACGTGASQSVARLLDAHADAGLVLDTGASALSAAVSARRADIVRALVAVGVPLDLRHGDAVTVLMIAAARGYPDMVALVRSVGAQIDAADARGRTALHAAARFCFDSRDSLRCRRLLDTLLQDNPAPDTADKAGTTPLLVLLGVDAPPGNDGDGTHLSTLMPALLDADAAIAQADEHGVTPLHACAMHALFEPARMLLARGADRQARDCMQRTPAQLARALGYVDLALELSTPRDRPLDPPIVTPLMTHPE